MLCLPMIIIIRYRNKIKYYFNGVEISGGGVGSLTTLNINKSGVTQYIGRMDQGRVWICLEYIKARLMLQMVTYGLQVILDIQMQILVMAS